MMLSFIQESDKMAASFLHVLKLFKSDAATQELYKESLADLMTVIVVEITALIDQVSNSTLNSQFVYFFELPVRR